MVYFLLLCHFLLIVFFIEVFSQNYSLAASQNLSFVLSLVFHRPHVRSFCYLLRFLLCRRRADTLIT